MKIVLLQDEIYLPSFAGGTKANRALLEQLAVSGHDCLALTRALTRSPDGPNDVDGFRKEMLARGLAVRVVAPEVYAYRHAGVAVEALDCPDEPTRYEYCRQRITVYQPDWVLVADDKRRFMLAAAGAAAPGRCVPLLQTIVQLPFGPLAVQPHEQQTQWMQAAPLIMVISRYMQSYVRDYGGMDSQVVHLPVYGAGPFPDLACHARGYVTMINPCELKGLSIFVALARAFPQVAFAAVPTWGANPGILQTLREIPNIRLLPAQENIEEILRQTRILCAPSLWPESFGYIVPEAMLRGIPVLASDLGGLPEAKLGVDYLLPVHPAVRCGSSFQFPPQPLDPWIAALGELLADQALYQRCSRQSKRAAQAFVAGIDPARLERVLQGLSKSDRATAPGQVRTASPE